MRHLRVWIAPLALLVLAAALLWQLLPQLRPATPTARCAGLLAPRQAPLAASADTALQWYEQHLAECPDDQAAYVGFAAALLQQARETADPAFYSRAEQALDQALSLRPDDELALTFQGLLALARHEFEAALELGRRAQSLNPDLVQSYAVIADAQIELGQYEQARATIQQLVNLRPDLSSYTRVAYLRELYGDRAGAISAMRRALEAGAPAAEHSAWTAVQLGNLYFGQADLANAEQAYAQALQFLPEYVPALAAQARLAAARGDLQAARTGYALVLERMPLAEYAIAAAELELADGKPEAAQRLIGLVQLIDQLSLANGVQTDLEMALFLADHGDPALALERAQAAYARRPGIHGAHALAWALSQAGRQDAAQTYIDEALRLGTRDALLFYHAGQIAWRRGDYPAARAWLARALDLNPAFSPLYAPQARQLLAQASVE